MTPSAITEDYYAVLGVARTANADALKAAWRKLARIKHPDKNPGNPTATAEFQLLESAYSTLCDPTRRRAYDLQRPPTFTNNPTAENHYQSYASTASRDSSEQKNRERESKRDKLHHDKRRAEADVTEARRSLNRISDGIKKLDEDARKDIAEETTWWGYFSSIIPGSKKQRDERARDRDRRNLDRIAAKRVKERELERQMVKVTLLEATLHSIQAEINKVTLEINKWREEQAAIRRREEQRQQEQYAKQREEQAAAWRREAQQKQEEFARRERARRKEEEAEAAKRASEWEERSRREREREEATARIFEEILRAAQKDQRETDATESCTHKAWWKKVEGPHTCSNCSIRTTRFALQCPQCRKIACASCRKLVQAQAGGQNRRFRRGM
ncbi:hypothetical protein GGR53DRAFT_54410 [Hypoxylon sp. FL1150]|nr:hypothetical protein GGR53DRAFT_54410 [Hypoxylon sp. FL1150]